LLTLTACRSVVLYGLLLGPWAPNGPITERSTLSRVSITNRCWLIQFFFSFSRRFMSDFRNQYTSHTSANQECNVPKQAPIINGGPAFTGTVNTNCSSSSSRNTGGTFLDTSNTSFGQDFANTGGGVFALLWNNDGFRI